MSLFSELKRRNVFKVGLAYIVVSWLTIQVVSSLSPMLELPDIFGKMILVILLVGFPIALLFAWAFELTPDGVKPTGEVDASESIANKTSRKIDFIIIGALVLIIGGLAFERLVFQSSPTTQDIDNTAQDTTKSIAVLPFVNMSDDPSQEFFSDGISEELLNVLAKVEGLRVTSRTSAFAFKGTNTPIPEVAANLGVAHVLEGSVRKQGDKVRITAQLIEVATDSHLWSQTYDRDLDNIFAIQDEIAQKVVEELKIALFGLGSPSIEKIYKTDVDVYSDYLMARQLWADISVPNLNTSIGLLETVIDRDPNFAKAYSTLAGVYRDSIAWGAISASKAQRKIKPLLETVLELNPENAEAWQIMAYLKKEEGDLFFAKFAEDKALEIDPLNWWVLRGQVAKWSRSHTPEKGLGFAEDLHRIDPLSARGLADVAQYYFRVGENEKGLDILARMKEIDPKNLDYIWYNFSLERQRGRLDLSLFHNVEFISIDALDPESYGEIGYLLMAAGAKESLIQSWIDKGVKTPGPKRVKNSLAQMLLFYTNDEKDKAFEIAEFLAKPETNNRGMIYKSRSVALRLLSLQDSAEGNIQRAIDRYEFFYSSFDQGKFLLSDQTVPTDLFMSAIDLGALYQKSGDEEKADFIFKMIEKELPFWNRVGLVYEYTAGITEVELHALQGNKQAALVALRAAIDDGWAVDAFWLLEMNPYLENIKDEPEFKALVSEVNVKLTAQLEKMMAAGLPNLN